MAIKFYPETKTFFLDGKNMTYAFRINDADFAEHCHFGSPIGHDDLSFCKMAGATSMAASVPGDAGSPMKSYGYYPPEITFYGTGDFREPTVQIETPDGARLCQLLYTGYDILAEKPAIKGMPSMRGGETLVLHLKDPYIDFGADLYYTVYDDCSAIARRIVYINGTKDTVILHRAYSFAFALHNRDYKVMSLYGQWAGERSIQETPAQYGVISVDSKLTSSSAILNPFIGLIANDASETYGDAYGVNLIYSSSFVLKAQGLSDDRLLVTGGINDFDFRWTLEAGEEFETPEALMVYSNEGVGGMSRQFHDAMREHLINQKYAKARRPLVINNWEGTYFDFTTDKLKEIASASAGLGIDTFVLDDGWFGKRDDDWSGLGDWVVNEKKLVGGLDAIIEHVNSLGMKFGLWFESEMVNEDSDLFRAHPDYAIGAPVASGRPRCYSRHQYVLDLTRKDVRDYIVESVNKILRNHHIEYVKWDYNRAVTESCSQQLPPHRQMEFAHRYALGLYDIFDRIVFANPDVFFEGCSSGGARFDGAVLAYFPQIWTSDNSDAEKRTEIQYGTSIVYPQSAMSAHVSAVPNHQTGRVTCIETRAAIAWLCATGYELDMTTLTEEEREKIKVFNEEYRTNMEDLVLNGDLYRTENPQKSNYFAETLVSKDKSHAVLTFYRRIRYANFPIKHIRPAGLDPNKTYKVKETGLVAKGSTLMALGYPPILPGSDFATIKYHYDEEK